MSDLPRVKDVSVAGLGMFGRRSKTAGGWSWLVAGAGHAADSRAPVGSKHGTCRRSGLLRQSCLLPQLPSCAAPPGDARRRCPQLLELSSVCDLTRGPVMPSESSPFLSLPSCLNLMMQAAMPSCLPRRTCKAASIPTPRTRTTATRCASSISHALTLMLSLSTCKPGLRGLALGWLRLASSSDL